MHERGEARRPRQIHVRIRLNPVPVASADQDLVPLARQRSNLAILIPVPQAIQLNRVAVLPIDREKVIDQEAVLLLSNAVEIPQRVVEHDQHAGKLVQLRQHVRQHLRGTLAHRDRRERLHPLHPLRTGRAGQVVNAKVKRSLPERHRPLHRHRNLPRRRKRPQQHRCTNVVVVGDRHHRCHLQLVLNLQPLQVERQPRSQRRSPVAARVVGPNPRGLEAALLAPTHQRLQHTPVGRQLRDKIQCLVRLIGVAMQRHSGCESLGGMRLAP